MLLIVTNRYDATADFLEEKISKANLSYARFNTEEFPLQVGLKCGFTDGVIDGTFSFPTGMTCRFDDVSAIWWRRPYLIEATALAEIEDDEAKRFASLQIKDTLEGVWGIFANRPCLWVNNPADNRRAESRLWQMEVASRLGFTVPATIISNEPKQIVDFFLECERLVVHKVIRRTAFFFDGKMYGFYTKPFAKENLDHVDTAQLAPVYLQKLIEKRFELRVTVVGENVFTARIDSQEPSLETTDWRRIPAEKQKWEVFNSGKDFEKKCVQLIKSLNLKFGTIDFAITPSGEMVFFEVNPNGQWAWLEIQIGLPISEAFLKLFSDHCST